MHKKTKPRLRPFHKLPLDTYIKFLIIISLFFSLFHLILYPLPQYIFNGDVTLHYKLTGLILKDPTFLAYENYPKLFHILSAVLVNIFNLPIGMTLYTLTIISALFLPYFTYKVSFELTKNKSTSLISALFSIIIIFYNSMFVGASPVPQTMSLTLIPLVFYLYLRQKTLYAGVFLGFHILLHGSWPVSVLFISIYTILDYIKKHDKTRIKNSLIIFLTGYLVSLPLTFYIKTNLFHDTITSGVQNSLLYLDSMISIFWLPLIITPILIVPIALYGCRMMYKKNLLENTNYLFLVVMIILIALSTQLYLFDIRGTALGITFIPSRNVPYLSLPLSVLSAYVVYSLKNKFKIVAVCIILILLSLSQSTIWYQRTVTKLDHADLETINFLEKQEFGEVFYNPIKYNSKDYFVIELGVKERLDRTTGFMLLAGRNDVLNNVSYVLEDKKDKYMRDVVENNRDTLYAIYSNDKYNVYRVKTGGETKPIFLSDYTKAFAIFLKNHPKGQKIFSSTTMVMFQTENERHCIKFPDVAANECRAYDIKISGKSKHIKELLQTYSITEFIYRLNWFYSQGAIEITTNDGVVTELNIPSNINWIPVRKIAFKDLNMSIEINKQNGTATISSPYYQHQTHDFVTTSKFASKTFNWVLLNSRHTYPNILFGLVYASVSESLNF